MTDALEAAEPSQRGSGDAGDLDLIRRLLEQREGRSPEELLDDIASLIGIGRRFSRGIYQKPLG